MKTVLWKFWASSDSAFRLLEVSFLNVLFMNAFVFDVVSGI